MTMPKIHFGYLGLFVALLFAPFFVYPVLVMKVTELALVEATSAAV